MKFSTGSSSSSNASDSLSRKSTLCIYTDIEMPPIHYEKMDTSSEAMELRRELDAVKSALQTQSESLLKQRHKLIETTNALASRNSRAYKERKLRQDQLALVIRSLVLLEARLTKEQKQLDNALRQKDNVIRSQQEELTRLRAKKIYCSNCQQLLGFTSEQTNIETDPEFQSLESTDSRFKTNFMRSCSYHERQNAFQKNTRLSKSFQIPKHDVVYGNTSSSEEGNNILNKANYVKNKQVFVRKDIVRRSRKYSGRKQNSVYLDSVQNHYNNQANSSSAEEYNGMSYLVNQPVVAKSDTAENREQTSHEEINNKAANSLGPESTFSLKIESLHGIKRQSESINATRAQFLNNVLKEDGEKPWYANNSDPEQETICPFNNRLSRTFFNKSKSADDLLSNFESGTLVPEVISAKNEILCSQIKNSIVDDFSNKRRNEKLYTDESNENWYASGGSDHDGNNDCEIYKNNPVLECVNQILLQNSLDESSNETSKSSESPSPKSAKRVHFSTLNSISVGKNSNDIISNTLPRQNNDRRPNKIVKFSLETASEHSYEVPNTAFGYNYEVQSIYSNDYEPIITKKIENNRPVPLPRTITPNFNITHSVSGETLKRTDVNHYTDVNSNSEVLKKKVPRTPPALPPKPKNLVSKFRFDREKNINEIPLNSETVVSYQRIPEVKTRKVIKPVPSVTSTEPDYCSISEINVPVVTNGKREILLNQPSVEIHTEKKSDKLGDKHIAKIIALPRIQTLMKDEDIPKLPQVKEIIIPQEDHSTPKGPNSKCFTLNTSKHLKSQPSVTLHSPIKLEYKKSIQMGNSISNILSEINKGVAGNDDKSLMTEIDGDLAENSQNTDISMSEIFEEIDKFDLSQNFEEFKIDACDIGNSNLDAEEYRISSSSSDGDGSERNTDEASPSMETKTHKKDVVIVENMVNNNYHIEIKVDRDFHVRKDAKNDTATPKLTNKPDLLSNIDNVEGDSMRNSDLESSNSSGSNSGSYNTVKCEPGMFKNDGVNKRTMPFDVFLESSGLSNKSLIHSNPTYAGLQSRSKYASHKNVLKPKDIKSRVKNTVTTNKNDEKKTAIKYFEPYL